MERLFGCLISLQFLVVVIHDWIDVPGWTHGRQVRAVVGGRKLLWATLINAAFPGAAVGLALWFWDRPWPRFAGNYWAIYCALTVVSALLMWYLPYFCGTNAAKTREYAQMYAGTRHVLPARGDHPRPNLLHICFHILFVATLVLALLLRSRSV
jgi:hypothetical protein